MFGDQPLRHGNKAYEVVVWPHPHEKFMRKIFSTCPPCSCCSVGSSWLARTCVDDQPSAYGTLAIHFASRSGQLILYSAGQLILLLYISALWCLHVKRLYLAVNVRMCCVGILADEAMSRSLGPGVEWLYIQCFCCGVCDVQKMTWVTAWRKEHQWLAYCY